MPLLLKKIKSWNFVSVLVLSIFNETELDSVYKWILITDFWQSHAPGKLLETNLLYKTLNGCKAFELLVLISCYFFVQKNNSVRLGNLKQWTVPFSV